MTTFEGGSLAGAVHHISSAYLVGGWAYPSEKYESQLGWFFPIYGKIKNGPNQQPDIPFFVCSIHALPLSRLFFSMFFQRHPWKKSMSRSHMSPKNQISRLRPLAEEDDSNAKPGFLESLQTSECQTKITIGRSSNIGRKYPTLWSLPVISCFVIPMNYSFKYHQS